MPDGYLFLFTNTSGKDTSAFEIEFKLDSLRMEEPDRANCVWSLALEPHAQVLRKLSVAGKDVRSSYCFKLRRVK